MDRSDLTGILAIFTGDGKGQTSAALGAVCRAVGHGCRARMIQFIKSDKRTGELALSRRLAPDFELEQVGLGFTWREETPREEHIRAARRGLELAREAITSGRYGIVVLDEILYALRGGLISLQDVLDLCDLRPETMHLILTGRGAPPELIARADMVTEMRAVKHHSQDGIPAQRCLDY
ncbi:MAG: cob(I)yrinic acid a,c-diamide adenosyltransferase [Nitrospinae bacterium]|nr:cob(I)yrinic acid a,c-diamide adenosyltransferase [Nitrospinota bacterium]